MRLPPQPDAEIPSAIMTGASAPGGVRPALPGGSAAPHAPQSLRGAVASRFLAFAKSSGQPLREILKAEIAKSAGLHASSRKHAVGKLGLKLSYSPINPNLYCLAFDGALAGMQSGRVPLAVNTAAYVNQAVAATVWAQEFDTVADNGSNLDAVTADLIYGQSYAIWTGRSASSLTAAQCTPIIVAILTSIAVALAEVFLAGVTPPPFGNPTNVFEASANSPVLLGGTLMSVVEGGLTINPESQNSVFTATFMATPSFASGQNNATIEYAFVRSSGGALPSRTISCPTASAYQTAFAMQNSPGLSTGETFDVQALTSAASEASSSENVLLLTEYVQ